MFGKTVAEIAKALRAKEFSSVELTRAYLDRIGRLNGELNAYITVCDEKALAQAEAADQRLAA